jgi:hypothetical protein
MNDLDLLDRALTLLYADLRASVDLCEDADKKRYYQGRVAGLELAVALFSAWKREVEPELLNEWSISQLSEQKCSPTQ